MATQTTNLDMDNYYDYPRRPVGEQNDDETNVATVCSDDYRFNPDYLDKNLKRASDFKFAEHFDIHGNEIPQQYDYLPDQLVEKLELRRGTERVMLSQLDELRLVNEKIAQIKGKSGSGKGMERENKKEQIKARMRKKLDDRKINEAEERFENKQ